MTPVQQAVQGYTEAWMNGDLAKARTYLADDLDFEDSVNRFDSADDYVRALG
jgi:hypothetical protein